MADTKAAVTVVTAPKSFDMYTAPDFRRAIRHTVEHGAGFVVADLAGTEFMDGLGCGVLAGALRLADVRGGLRRATRTADSRGGPQSPEHHPW